MFDDSLLDDAAALRVADPVLRRLAEAGARLRRESAGVLDELSRRRSLGSGARSDPDGPPMSGLLDDLPRPRAVVAAGPESRFVRALLEPVCPVPFVAWPTHGLPGWVGALDLVVVLASAGSSPGLIATVHEAVRRGSRLIVACPDVSVVAEHAASRSTTIMPTTTGDPLAAAIAVLAALHEVGLGPEVRPDLVAEAMDVVAEDCSPYVDVAENPAKDLALSLGDSQPLLWGGSVLASRASRRVAEALRTASGRAALAADADELVPILEAAQTKDPFADPYEDAAGTDRRPCLLMFNDGAIDNLVRSAETRLRAAADRNDIRCCVIAHESGSDVERYATLLQTGMYAAVYLAVGLGRLPS